MKNRENVFSAFSGTAGLIRAAVPLAVLVIAILCAIAARHDPEWLWGLGICIVLLGVAVHDLVQRDYAVLRNYPLLGWARYLFKDLRPYLRSYIVEGDLEGRPFNQDQRTLVYERSRGQEDNHPFGTELDVYGSEYKWITHSIAARETKDHDPRVMIGGPQCSKPYKASILNISAMSFGAISARAVEALNTGAKIGGFAHDTGEGSISPYHRKGGGDLIWQVASGYFGCRDANGHFDPDLFEKSAKTDQVKMIEIKLSQGAKPGHGGVLPGAKVTAEIAETRKVPQGEDCVSPAGHSAFSTPREMLQFAQKLRDLSGGKPVGIKLCVGHPHEPFAIVKAMLETGIYLDFVVVDGAEGGTGAAPIELSNHVGMPLYDGLVVMRNALVGAGLKEHVALGASGKVHSGSGIAHAIAMGADWVNAARAFMFSIGCIQSMSCHTGKCPTGIATQDPRRQRGLVVEDKAEQVARFHRKTVEAAMQIVSSAGLGSIHDLEPHHLFHRVSPTEARTADRIYPYIAKGQLLEAPEETPYEIWWNAASADSFNVAREVGEEHKAKAMEPQSRNFLNAGE